jgi:hypothetical protein
MRIYTFILDSCITKQILGEGNCINITACFVFNWDVCVEGRRKYCSWNLSMNFMNGVTAVCSVAGWRPTEPKRKKCKDKCRIKVKFMYFCIIGNEVCFQGSVRVRHTLFLRILSVTNPLCVQLSQKESLMLSNYWSYTNSFKTYFFPSGCQINSHKPLRPVRQRREFINTDWWEVPSISTVWIIK